MTTTYEGIDYGFRKTNISESGIRFGVIPQNSAVLQAWSDSSEPHYNPCCPYCSNELSEIEPQVCPACEKEIVEGDFDIEEPTSWFVDDKEYCAECGSSGDIFISKSPYFTYAQFCSPCAPGACYLLNPLEEPAENNKCYCFGHDWFDDDKAPYKVYSIETGELVSE